MNDSNFTALIKTYYMFVLEYIGFYVSLIIISCTIIIISTRSLSYKMLDNSATKNKVDKFIQYIIMVTIPIYTQNNQK
jgi:hypothetical protein